MRSWNWKISAFVTSFCLYMYSLSALASMPGQVELNGVQVGSEFQISWTAVSSVTGYEVHFSDRPTVSVPAYQTTLTFEPYGATEVYVMGHNGAWEFTKQSNIFYGEQFSQAGSQQASSSIPVPQISEINKNNNGIDIEFTIDKDWGVLEIYRDDQLLTSINDHWFGDKPGPGPHTYKAVLIQGDKRSQFSNVRHVDMGGVSQSLQSDSQSQMPSQLDDYKLYWEDAFDGHQIDGSKWNTKLLWGANERINDEQQIYIDRLGAHKELVDQGIVKNPFQFTGNHLKIAADNIPDHEKWRDSLKTFAKHGNTEWRSAKYSSGVITSFDKKEFTFGYFEFRAKMPSGGRGFFPAFWLLHKNYSGWLRPEIDIFEFLGHEKNISHHTYHMFDGGESDGNRVEHDVDLSADFHTYGLLWEQDTLIWFIDGVAVKKRHSWESDGNPARHIPNEPMYLLLNLAVGGEWPGDPDENTWVQSPLEVDYVKVFKHKDRMWD